MSSQKCPDGRGLAAQDQGPEIDVVTLDPGAVSQTAVAAYRKCRRT